MRIIIGESEKNDILAKYNDNTSDRLLTYLRRNYPIYFVNMPRYDAETDDYKEIKVPMVVIDDKSIFVEDNKKRIVNKISFMLEDEFMDISSEIKRRTIKKYIDMILSSKTDGE
jgi:hypothetical protein